MKCTKGAFTLHCFQCEGKTCLNSRCGFNAINIVICSSVYCHRMSLSVSQDEGVTVITITSNPNSKWPILCQILGTPYVSTICLLPKNVNREMMSIETALGVSQTLIH